MSEELYTKTDLTAAVQIGIQAALASMHLDNSTAVDETHVCQGDYDMANKKIRRPIQFNGCKVWICADNEQDYVNQIIALYQTSGKATEEKDTPTLRDFAKEWYELHAPNIGIATRKSYQQQLDIYIYPALGDIPLNRLTSSDIQKMFNDMKGVCTETKKKVRTVLSLILKKAYSDDLIGKNPLSGGSISVKGKASTETKPYEVEQMSFLIKHIPDLKLDQDKTYLAIHTMHPLRLEEVLGLQWQDVDFENNVFHIRRAVTHPDRNKPVVVPLKTESSKRDISITPAALQYLTKGQPTEFVIGAENPFSYTQVRRMCERIERELHFEEKITPLRFRTTVLTDVYDQTKDVKQTQLAAGHTTPTMTLKYYIKGRNVNESISKSIQTAYGI